MSRVVGLYSPLQQHCELLVVSPSPGQANLPWSPIVPAEQEPSAETGSDVSYLLRTFTSQFRERVKQKAWEFQPDYLIAEGLWAGPAVRKAADALKVPWGLTVHDVLPLTRGHGSSSLFKPILRFYERRTYRHADRLFTKSYPETVRIQKALLPTPPRFSVIPDGAHLARMVSETEVEAQRTRWHIQKGERIGLFVGRLDLATNRLGLEWFSHKVAPLIGDLPFRIRWLAAGIPEPATPIPPFEFIGLLEDPALALATVDLCISPTHSRTGASLHILDSFGAGCPVVATPHSIQGLPIETDRHALISAQPEEFARFIRMILLDSDLAESLGSSARQLIAEQLNWERISEKMFRDISRTWGLQQGPPGLIE
jgi:glycosyltransferase involved in cell wall biosynthesis